MGDAPGLVPGEVLRGLGGGWAEVSQGVAPGLIRIAREVCIRGRKSVTLQETQLEGLAPRVRGGFGSGGDGFQVWLLVGLLI